jgi:hypothetical protein
MGFLDDLLPGGTPTFKPSPVDLDGVVGAWYAGRTKGGWSLAGGGLVLGNDWLVFSPWNMDRTRAWLVKWLGKAGVPHLGQVDKLITATGLLEPVAIPRNEIESAHVLSEGSLFKPPEVRLVFTNGGHFDLGILASPTSMNPDPDNLVALQDFLAKLLAHRTPLGAPTARTAAGSSADRPPQSHSVAVAASPAAYDGPVNASPMARAMAMDQLRAWKSTLAPAEFSTAKARKLGEVGLVAGSPPQAVHVSPMSQQLAVEQANGFASLVDEGVLTAEEYQTVRHVILRDNGLA